MLTTKSLLEKEIETLKDRLNNIQTAWQASSTELETKMSKEKSIKNTIYEEKKLSTQDDITQALILLMKIKEIKENLNYLSPLNLTIDKLKKQPTQSHNAEALTLLMKIKEKLNDLFQGNC